MFIVNLPEDRNSIGCSFSRHKFKSIGDDLQLMFKFSGPDQVFLGLYNFYIQVNLIFEKINSENWVKKKI